MVLSYGLSGRVIQTWVILWVVRAVYPDMGYPMCCPGGLSGWGLSGRLSGRVIRMSVIRAVYPGVGYPGTRRFFGRWTTGDLIPKSPLRRGYLIWRLILVVACTLSRSKFALSDLIGPYRPFFKIHCFSVTYSRIKTVETSISKLLHVSNICKQNPAESHF